MSGQLGHAPMVTRLHSTRGAPQLRSHAAKVPVKRQWRRGSYGEAVHGSSHDSDDDDKVMWTKDATMHFWDRSSSMEDKVTKGMALMTRRASQEGGTKENEVMPAPQTASLSETKQGESEPILASD